MAVSAEDSQSALPEEERHEAGFASREPGDRPSRKLPFRRGRQRWATGLNACFSVLLAFVALVMVNDLSRRYYVRWDMSASPYYSLSDKTRGLLGSLHGTVRATVFFDDRHALYGDIRNLLDEYEYVSRDLENLTLLVEYVDPRRDLSRAREIVRRYDLVEPNQVVFEMEGRRKYVKPEEVAEYEVVRDGMSGYRRLAGFKGEQAFSSAIQSISEARAPVVYFLKGHGEHDLEDYAGAAGYASLARAVRRDNIELRTLYLAAQSGVPPDCAALIVAGPDRRFSRVEIEWLTDYLAGDGRMLLLLNPATETGLEPLLAEWGVRLGNDVVVGWTLTGRELVVKDYGAHPVTKRFQGLQTVFYTPRSVEPLTVTAGGDEEPADRPRVSVLAMNTKEGWAESDLAQRPPVFDEGVDRRGPVSIAVAVERGVVRELDMTLRPTRMIVVGDSYFVSNGALKTGVGGNLDFFLSALNWLLEREALLAIAPKASHVLRLEMSRGELRRAGWLIVGAVPGAAALAGLVIWMRRRR